MYSFQSEVQEELMTIYRILGAQFKIWIVYQIMLAPLLEKQLNQNRDEGVIKLENRLHRTVCSDSDHHRQANNIIVRSLL